MVALRIAGVTIPAAIVLVAACASFGVADGGLAADAAAADADAGAADAAPSVGACGDGGVMVVRSFGAAEDLSSFVTRADGVAGPSIDLDAGIALLRSTDQAARDSIWFASTVPLDAFDVTFEVRATCSGANCGDGLAFVWLDTTSVDAGLAQGVTGGDTLGIPSKVGGNAVAVDLLKGPDPVLNDPDNPALEIIRLDSTRFAATYPWVVSGTQVLELEGPAWNTIAISVRGGRASVTAAGAHLEAGVAPVARGVFGITAAAGDSTAAFNVRNLRASFGCALQP